METPNQTLTAAESLDIIAKMIQEAKGNVKRNSIYLLLWGFVTVAANLGMFIFIQIDYPRPYLIWLITIPAWIATLFIAFKQGKSKQTTSHLDTINASLWFSYGVTILAIVGFGFKINYQINPIVLVMSAVPAFVSGVIIKFRPLMLGGIFYLIFGVVCFLVDGPWQYLVGAIAVTAGFLIPGFMLQNKTDL
ncbi:MAG TPA: hypothetical protein VEW65_10065 [Chryseolinea sp.]|nr:hypothetical protein [Chryseolinea sp.]